MDKCKWKDGKFVECCKASILLSNIVNFCPFCGADIRKPEEKPLIVKSGGTWAAHWKGVDYLWLGESLDNEFQPRTILRVKLIDKNPGWNISSEIELTDEIAKLRPMVRSISLSLMPAQLWGVKDSMGIFSNTEDRSIDHYRLATPHELQEAE